MYFNLRKGNTVLPMSEFIKIMKEKGVIHSERKPEEEIKQPAVTDSKVKE
jgi:hypothetical protein